MISLYNNIQRALVKSIHFPKEKTLLHRRTAANKGDGKEPEKFREASRRCGSRVLSASWCDSYKTTCKNRWHPVIKHQLPGLPLLEGIKHSLSP